LVPLRGPLGDVGQLGTAFLILLLLTLCGFIAYIGDLLGRRLGKKRLTIFGLRPKHTAILLTVVTGVLIAGVTFSAALVSMGWFRSVVFQGERLARQNQRLRESGFALKRQADELASQSKQKETENQRLSSENEKLAGTNRALSTQNQGLQSRNSTLQTESRTLRTSNDALREQKARLQQSYTLLTSSLSRLQAERGRLTSDRERLAGAVAMLRATIAKNRGEVSRLEALAQGYRAEEYIFRRGQPITDQFMLPNPPLDVLRRQVGEMLFRADQKAAALKAAADGVHPRLWLVPTDARAPRAKNADVLEAVIKQATKIRDRPILFRIVAEENCVAQRPVPARFECFANDQLFRAGEVVATGMSDGSAPDFEVYTDLVTLLQRNVTNEAKARGMLPSEEGFGNAHPQLLFETIRRVKQHNGPVILRARVRQNTFRSGPLYLDIDVAPADAAATTGRNQAP
jgi:uncharacterized protein (DUF3084 family)